MKKSILSFLLILTVLLSMNFIGNGEDISVDSDGNVYVDGILDTNRIYSPLNISSLDNKTPDFQIIAMVDKRKINAGENFTISYQLTGSGKVISNKLITYFPIELLKDKPIYYLYISEAKKDEKTIGAMWYNHTPNKQMGDKEGAFISFVNIAFMNAHSDINTTYGELVVKGHRPIYIKANTSLNAPEGDHIVKICLFYSDGERWYSSQDEVVIHINSWAEQNEFLIGIIIPLITTGIGAFLGFITAFYLSEKWNTWRKK